MASARIGALRVDLGMNTAAFEKGATLAERRMNKLSKSIEKMGTKMQSIGKTMTLAVTAPLAAFGVSAFKAASDAAEMESAFEVTFGNSAKSVRKWAEETGDAMGRSTQEMQSMAASFQDILKKQMDPRAAAEMSKNLTVLTQDLASFKNLSNEVAQQKIFSGLIGEAEPLRAVGVLLSDQAVQAKAAALGLEKLNGKFTEGAKVQARAALITEQLADAQGDVMRTSASTANQIKRSKAAFEELQVAVGTKLLPVITPLIEKIGALLDKFSKLPDSVQTTIIAVAGLAAALGPLLYVVGGLVKFAAPMLAFTKVLAGLALAQGSAGAAATVAAAGFGSLAASLAAVALPVAAVAAAGYLIYRNWDKIGPVLTDLWNTIKSTIGPPLMEVIDALSDAFAELWNGPLGAMLRPVSNAIQQFAGIALSVLGRALVEGIKLAVKVIGAMLENLAATIRFVASVFDGSLAHDAFRSVQRLVNGVREWIVGKLNAIWKSVTDKIETVKRAFFGLYDAVVGNSYVPDMVDGIAEHMARLDKAMVDPATRAAKKTAEVMREMAAEVRSILDRLFPEAAQLVQYRKELALLDGAGLSESQRTEAQRRLGMELSGFSGKEGVRVKAADAGPLVASGQVAKQIEEIERRLGLAANRTQTQTVRIAKSFKDMAQETMTALTNMVNAIKGGGFLDILSGVLNLVLQLGSIGLFGSKFAGNVNKVDGARAAGGPVSLGKSYLVGEKGPELFTPGQSGHITPNHAMGGGIAQIVPSPYFDVVVDGRIIRAAPAMIGAGAAAGVGRMQSMNDRMLG